MSTLNTGRVARRPNFSRVFWRDRAATTNQSAMRPAWSATAGVLGATALLLLLANLLLLYLAPNSYRIPVGNYRDEFFLTAINTYETAPDGTTYRWTTDQTQLSIDPLGTGRAAQLALQLGGRPEATTAQLLLNGETWVDVPVRDQPSRLILTLPHNDRTQVIEFRSPTLANTGDSRRLGIKLEAMTLMLSRGGWPAWGQFLSQLTILGSVLVAGARLGWRVRGLALAGTLAALALAGVLVWQLPLASGYFPPLALGALILAGLTLLLLPHAERAFAAVLGSPREVRIIWAIMLAACLIRMIGMLYPTFDGQDLGRNVRRQLMSAVGQMYIMNSSAEFGKGQTIYPTGPYMALMPFLLLFRDVGQLIELMLSILEGSMVFLVALIAARLGATRDGARIAAVLFLASYASYSVHVYQFSAQIFGQWFTAPILLLLLDERPRVRTWGIALLLLMFGVYSHIGVAILGISWMGLTLLLATLKPDRTVWRAWGMFLGAVIVAAFLMYLNIIAQTVTHLGSVVGREGGSPGWLPGATEGLWKGLRLAYSDVGLVLLPIGAYLMWRNRPNLQALKAPIALLGVVLFYFAVDLLSRLQVRYFFFSLPLALALIALPLGYLAARGGWMRAASWLIAIAIALPNLVLWLQTTFGNGQISMTPLTH